MTRLTSVVVPGNYLRVRGEYWRDALADFRVVELPPRARRIRLTYHGEPVNLGTTSACAENTLGLGHLGYQSRNYLRVRGEYYGCAVHDPHHGELPPRARRIPVERAQQTVQVGTTSACAENTSCSSGRRCRPWNYLRVRGEYATSTSRKSAKAELPPRARRIP